MRQAYLAFRYTRRIAAVTLLGASVLAAGSRAAENVEAPTTDVRSVVNELRKGGYVIFLRHGVTEEVGASDEAADLERCETQRNLAPTGRAQAASIGKAIKGLGIPVGLVQSSPFCRAKDTAQIAFGTYVVNPDLQFVINMNATQTHHLADALRRLLATPPKKGTNTVLISHSANLREAAGIFAKPEGAAYVFRPLPSGRFEPVGRILPEDWNTMIAPRKRSATSP